VPQFPPFVVDGETISPAPAMLSLGRRVRHGEAGARRSLDQVFGTHLGLMLPTSKTKTVSVQHLCRDPLCCLPKLIERASEKDLSLFTFARRVDAKPVEKPIRCGLHGRAAVKENRTLVMDNDCRRNPEGASAFSAPGVVKSACEEVD